jgi:hypothetical protein
MRYLTLLFFLLFCTSISTPLSNHGRARNITSAKGYSNDIGVVSMLEDLKRRVTRTVASLSVAETDFLLDDKAKRVGAMIYHPAATEKYDQRYTFEGRGYLPEDAHGEFAPDLGAPSGTTRKLYYTQVSLLRLLAALRKSSCS